MSIGGVRKPLPELIPTDRTVTDESSVMIGAALARHCRFREGMKT
ncbi:MAG: hypothetical protein ACTTK0_06985 [Stomatobaculum sp.]